MEELDPRQRRLQLLAGLQERIGLIQLNISRLDSQMVATMDEKQRHEEDLQFYFQLVLELGGFDFDSDSEKDEATIQSSGPEIQNNMCTTPKAATMSRADLLELVESEDFQIHSREIACNQPLKYKCKYCCTASFAAEKDLRDHVYYCSIRAYWSEYYPQPNVNKKVKKTTWS